MGKSLKGREKLVQDAADAMRRNGRIPELAYLNALPDELLRAIISHHTGPFIVA